MLLTRFTSEKPRVLSKRIDIQNGELVTSTSANMSKGRAERVDVANVADLVNLLDSLAPSQAVGYGVCDLSDVAVVRAEDLNKTAGAVARSDKFFNWHNADGVLMLDYDPDKGREALSREHLIAQLATAAPLLFAGGWAWRPSASSCIVDTTTGEQLIGVSGQRVYVHVKRATDIKRAGEVLFKRLWLAGFGRIEVSSSGSLLTRSAIDGSVWQPSRLDFAAGAICGPGLARYPTPAMINNAPPVDTTQAIPDLSDAEDRAFFELVARAKHDATGEAASVRTEYAHAKAEQWGVTPEEAADLLNVADSHGVLCGNYPIHLDDKTTVTVEQLLADRHTYHGRKCLDPLEPNYRGGAVVGIIHLDGQPNIFSRAHGDRTFALGVDTAKAFARTAVAPEQTMRLKDTILEFGGDTGRTEGLLTRIEAEGGNELQRALLLAELTAQLKAAGVLTPAVRKLLESPAKAKHEGLVVPLPDVVHVNQIPSKRIGGASGDHGDNAYIMLKEVFQGRLATIDGTIRWWSGISWDRVDEDRLKLITYLALHPGQSKTPNVSGTVAALKILAPSSPAAARDKLVYFSNGVFNPADGSLSPHHPHNRNTGTLTTAFNPKASCPQWFEFLGRIFGGSADGQERIALLQEIIGWTMVRDSLGIQKSIAFDGVTRGGKGVILEVIQSILGMAICGQTTFAKLSDGKIQSAFRYYDVMMDKEAKPPQRQLIAETIGVLNKIASNEELTIPLLHNQDPWVGRPHCKMLIGCNGVPTLIDDSGASSNRLHVLHFDRSFEGIEDPTLADRLATEAEGVAMWALDGLIRLLHTKRFTTPATTREAETDMRDANQPLREFIAERCEIGPEHRCHSAAVYDAYRLYCMDAGIKLPGRNSFLRSFKRTLLGTPVRANGSIKIDGTVSTGYDGIKIIGAFDK